MTKSAAASLVMTDRAAPAAADLALALRPEQIASIERKFAENNEKFRKDTCAATWRSARAIVSSAR